MMFVPGCLKCSYYCFGRIFSRTINMLSLLLASVCMLTVVMVLGEVDASSRSKSLNTLPEFYSHDVLDDGETERALYWRGVAVKETSAIISLNGTK